MQILVQPMYSKAELNADSNYVIYTSLIRALIRARPEWCYVVIFPDDKSGYRYEEDGFFHNAQVLRLPQRISTRKMSNAASFDGAWYDRLFRVFGFDVVWCNLVEVAAQIRGAGCSIYEKAARPMVVAAHNYVIHETLPYPMHAMEHISMLQLVGAAMADRNVFNSDWCERMLFDRALSCLSPELIGKLRATGRRIDYGCLPDAEPGPFSRESDLPIIAYNHRLQDYKKHVITFRILRELWDDGERFEVWLLQNTMENTQQIRRQPFVKMKLSKTHEDYFRKLGACDLNVTHSVHETFCIAAIESMYYGQPLIAPNGVTFPQITGAAEGNGYPLLFESEAQSKQMIRRMLHDREQRQRIGALAQEHVRRSYGRKLWAERYASLFEESREEHRPNPAQDALEMFAACLKVSDGKRLHDLKREVYSSRVNGRTPFANQSCTPHKMVRLVELLGGRIDLHRGEQRIHAAAR